MGSTNINCHFYTSSETYICLFKNLQIRDLYILS